MPRAVVLSGKKGDRARALIARHDGAEIADYGRSLLVEVGDEGLDLLRADGFRVRELAERPTVSLRGFELRPTAFASADTAVPALATTDAGPTGRSYYVLGLAGPFHPDWRSELAALGVAIYESLEERTLLVGGEGDVVARLAGQGWVESIAPWDAPLKVATGLLTADLQSSLADESVLAELTPLELATDEGPGAGGGEFELFVDPPSDEQEIGNLELLLFEPDSQPEVVERLAAMGVDVIAAEEEHVVVFAEPDRIPELAAIPEVREINGHGEPELHNNVASGIVEVDTLREDHGLDGAGEVVAIADSGLDTGVDGASMLADFRGRIVSIHALGRPGDASDTHNHGTHVAGSVLGDGSSSNGRIRGMAPAARLVFQSIMDANRKLGGLPSDLATGLYAAARAEGARIHSNSWGTRNSNGAYNIKSRQTDSFAFDNRDFLIVYSAGNDAPKRTTAPGTAKNALTVGASESLRPLPQTVELPGNPGRTIRLAGRADNADQVASFSCPGPATGNRVKPDVVAPGTFILSTRSTVSTADVGPDGIPGTGDEDGVFTHDEAVGRGLPGRPFFGVGNCDAPAAPPGSGTVATENHFYSSGTSMAAPITAGACALVRQFFRRERGHEPSAALLKALMINGARDIGSGVPDNQQGWGRIDLARSLAPTLPESVQFDDTLTHAVSATDPLRTYRFSLLAVDEPTAVTLVWRDPPNGSRIQNRLHLRLFTPGNVELTAEPPSDVRNNVQKIVVASAESGVYTIEVEALEVSRGIPESDDLAQDFALVVSNASELAMDF